MKTQYKQLFQNKNYLKLFLADNINRFGDSLDIIVMTLLVYTLTQSATWSAIIFAVNRLPTIFIQPLAGTYIEKRDKKQIMIMSDCIRAFLVCIIATELLLGILNQWSLLVLTFLISFAEAFRQPASMSVIPQILDREELDIGLSLNNSVSKTVELLGTALAGVMISFLGSYVVIYMDMVTFIVSAIFIGSMSLSKKVYLESQEESFFQQFKDGIRIIYQFPRLKLFIILAVYFNAMMTPYQALQAPLVEEVLHSSSMMLSIISTSFTLGMIIGSVVYPILKDKISVKIILIFAAMMLSVTYIGVCMIGEFLEDQSVVSLTVISLFFMVGASVGFINMFANIELYKLVPEDYLTRVTALTTSTCVCMMPIVSFVVGIFAMYFSTAELLILIGMINIILFVGYFSKKLSFFD